MAFYLAIDGLEISGKVTGEGYRWSENDLHAESSGRTLDGTMRVKRIGIKAQLDVSCAPMSEAEAQEILSALRSAPEFTVKYTDPVTGRRTATFYNSSRNCEFLQALGGINWWSNLKFTLTEC